MDKNSTLNDLTQFYNNEKLVDFITNLANQTYQLELYLGFDRK